MMSAGLMGAWRRVGGSPTPATIFGASLAMWLRPSGISGSPIDTWADDSGNANDATGTGTTRPANSGGYANFDGSDDYLQAADAASLDPSTLLVVGWVGTPDVTTSNRVPICKSNTTSGCWSFQTNTTGIRFHCGTPGVSFGETASALSASTAVRIIARYDGTQTGNSNRLKIYINGSLSSPSYTGTIPATLANTTNAVSLGCYANFAQYWDGLIKGAVIAIGHSTVDQDITDLDTYLGTL